MNVGLIAPGPGDGTSFYRAYGPFNYLARSTGINLLTADEWDWTNITRCNVMFMQRPFTDAHLMVARTCKASNVPLWVDYDDLYTAFPDWCQVQQEDFGMSIAVENMRQCVALADVVTVSTEGLKCLREDAVVVPNALNTYLFGNSTAPRQKSVTWRGSGGHNGDVEPIIPALQTFKENHKDWDLHFLGRIHWRAKKLGTVHPYRDLFSYMAEFSRIAPSVHIVPLADNEFNRAKSNIAWLEASAAGAVTIAPGFAEWKRPGIMNYHTEDGFPAALEMAVSVSEQERASALAQSRAYIAENLTLAKVNQQRIEILKRLQ